MFESKLFLKNILKIAMSTKVICPRAQLANLPARYLKYPFNAECQARKLWIPTF